MGPRGGRARGRVSTELLRRGKSPERGYGLSLTIARGAEPYLRRRGGA